MTTIPAFTIGGLTRPELHLDAAGNIVLDPAATEFASTYGLQYLYLGCPPGTPWPPVSASLLPPTDINSTSNSVVEGAAAGTLVNLTAHADSSAGNPVTYSLIGDSSGGGFKIDPSSGVVSVINPAKIDFESSGGSYTVTVQANDGILTSSQTFTIAVSNTPPSTPVDGNPAANSVAEGAAADTPVGITAVATDVNGPAVTWSLTADSSSGGFKINPNTGVITVADPTKVDFESAPGHAYTVTAQASDGHGGTSSQNFTISVTDLPPVISSPATASVNEGVAAHSAVYTAVAADPAGGTVTYSLSGTDAAAFAIDANTGVVTINASPDFETKSSYNFTVKASDPSGAFNTEAVTLSVNDLPPAISSPATASVNEGVAAHSTVYTAVAADPAGGTVTYSLTGADAAAFTIDANTGVVTINVSPDFETKSSYNFTVKASDPSGAFNTEAVTLSVNDLPPVISSAATASVNEGVAAHSTVYTAVAADPAGGTVTYSLSGADAAAFTIDANTGVVTINASPDFETKSSYNFTVKASDPSGAFNTEAVTLSINDLPPVISSPATASVNEGIAADSTVYTAVAADPGGGTVTYSLTGADAAAFTIDANTGVVTVNASPDFETKSSYNFTVKASDPSGAFNTQAVTLSVNDLPPVISSPATASVNEGVAAHSTVYTAVAADPAGGTVTYSLSGTDAAAFTIDANTGVVTINASPDFETKSSYSFTVKASDPSGAFNTEAVTLSINDVTPSTPVDSDGTPNRVAVGGPVGAYTGLTASSTDVNGPPVTYTLTGDTSHGAFTIDSSTGKVTVADPSKILLADPSYDVTVDSFDGAAHSQQIFTIQVVVDAAPVVTAGHTLSYTEKQIATAIDPAVTVSDSDNATLAHATVQITNHYVNGEDILGFTNTATITGSFNAATGTLTLTGNDTVANYQAALASVTYFNTSSNPSGLDRTVTFTANDGTLDSTPVTDTIHVTPVNDPPVVTAGPTLNYTENQAATAFDPAITVSDVDSANLVSATVQITNHYVSGEDVLAFSAQNNITGSFNSATGTLTLTGSSSVANYQAALASVTYVNTSENPSGLDRTVTIITNDGSANSAAVTDTIHVTPVNDPPVTTAGGTLNYLENQAATAIDPTVTVSDVDNANMASATVQITGNFASGQDVLGFTNQNGIIGSYNAATGTLTLTGSSSVANYKAALDSVTYFNSSDNPSGLDRTVSFTVNDGAANSNTSTSTIHVTPVNDAPVVSFGAITGFSEPPNGTPAANSTPVTIAPGVTISDVDSSNLTGVTFVLDNLKPSDALSISGHAGTSGDIGGIHFDISSTASTETITFTGTDTIAHYNSVLDLIQFNNTSENPDTTARHYTVTAVDDGGTANGGNNTGSGTATETVTAVNDVPTGSVPADNSIGTAFSHTNLAISGLSVADVDSGSGNVTATIASSHAGLSFDTTGLASFTNNGSHTVTLTGTTAQVNTALATLTYNSDDGFTGSDAVTLSVNDNGNTGSGGAQTSTTQTFHVGVVPQVFYIDNSTTGTSANLGTQHDPYTSIAAFNAANPAGSGDYVVLLHGTGTYTEANGINLANGVNLIGGSHTLQFTNPVTSAVVTANVASGTDPVIKVTGADNGIDLLGTSGHTITGISVDTSAGAGMGISDDGNNVGTVTMSDIVVKTAGGAGISFTHGGTVTVTGSNNTITSTTGTALDVENTSIGSGNLTFKSITSNGGSSDGIILSNTGTAAGDGGLHVTGDGSTAGSGGTIANKSGVDGSTSTGIGVYLNNTKDVQFSFVQMNDFSNYGILGNAVSGMTLNHVVVNGSNGDNVGGLGEGDVYLTGLTGSATVSSSTFTGAAYDSFHVFNNNGETLNRITITNSTFATNTAAGNQSNDALVFQATNGTFNATIQGSNFTSARGDLFQLDLHGGVSSDLVLGGTTGRRANTLPHSN